VGKSALEGLHGVESVTSGFSGLREVNTVVYDPTEVTRDQMVSALKKAGTFRGIKD
jgi:hypothetical protein